MSEMTLCLLVALAALLVAAGALWVCGRALIAAENSRLALIDAREEYGEAIRALNIRLDRYISGPKVVTDTPTTGGVDF